MFSKCHLFGQCLISTTVYIHIYIYYTVHIDIFLVSFSCDYPSIIALATSSLCCSSLLGPILTSGLWLPAGWMWRPCLQIGFRNGSIAMASSGTHTTVLRTNPCWLTDGDKDPCIVIFQNHSKNLQSLAMSHHVECARAYAMLTRSPYAALRKWGFCLRQTRYDKAVTKIVKGGFQTSSNAAWKHWTKT